MESAITWLGSSLLVILCIVFVLPLYSGENYSIVYNGIRDLGAQKAPLAWIMNFGLIFYAICMSAASFIKLDKKPIRWGVLASSVLLILGSMLRDAPIDQTVEHNELAASVNPLLIFASATVLSAAMLICSGMKQPVPWRLTCILAAITCFGIIGANVFLDMTGIWERMFIVVSGLWLYFYLLKCPWKYIDPVPQDYRPTR